MLTDEDWEIYADVIDGAIADGKLYIRCPGEGCTHLMQPEAFASKPALRQYRAAMRESHGQRLDGESDAGESRYSTASALDTASSSASPPAEAADASATTA